VLYIHIFFKSEFIKKYGGLDNKERQCGHTWQFLHRISKAESGKN